MESQWNLPPPPGFRGLRADDPIEFYHRHLPHWRQEGATYFVTFRLGDSLPQGKLRELERWRDEWKRKHRPLPSRAAWEELSREVMRRVETWLDEGSGCCVLRDPAAAAEIVHGMHHFDGVRYELDAYVVMPNHVHVLVRPLDGKQHPLEDILHSWKLYSARRISRPKPAAALWQDESFDRIVRDEEHLYRCVQYIGANPRKAGLAPATCPRWIRPEWGPLDWKFVDE